MKCRLVVTFLIISIPGLLWSQDKPKDEFTLVRQDGVISVYERWIIFPKSDPPVKAREVKGVFTINATTIYKALDLLKDETKIKKWQTHVSEFEVYLDKDTTTWLEYSYHDIPWPVSDQDHFLVYALEERRNGDELFITFETQSNPTLAPIRKGVTRMKLSGSWTLEKLSNNQIRATYRILSMPSSIPKMFTDPVIRSNMMSTIRYFIDLLEGKVKR